MPNVSSVAMYMMEQLFIIKATFVKNRYSFSNEPFPNALVNEIAI